MISQKLGSLIGHSEMADGIRADLISANFMLAIVILVFVGFFLHPYAEQYKNRQYIDGYDFFMCPVLFANQIWNHPAGIKDIHK